MPEVHRLQFVSGKYQGEEFALGPATSFIAGRSTEADLVLADDAVSRKHARFYSSRGRTWVRDLGSRNGTVVNGKPVLVACLRDGDRVAIGASLMRVSRIDASQITASMRAGERHRGARGAEETPAGRSMSGAIEDIPLVDVLQWLAQSRRTGALNVRGGDGGQSGVLRLREGRVYHAAIEDRTALHPEKALHRMLGWSSGTFDLDSSNVEDVEVEINMSLEHMLMEAARQQDEMVQLAAKATIPEVGAPVTVVQPSPVRWSELAPEELDVLQKLIEGGSWWDVLDESATDDLTLTKALVAMSGRGLVRY